MFTIRIYSPLAADLRCLKFKGMSLQLLPPSYRLTAPPPVCDIVCLCYYASLRRYHIRSMGRAFPACRLVAARLERLSSSLLFLLLVHGCFFLLFSASSYQRFITAALKTVAMGRNLFLEDEDEADLPDLRSSYRSVVNDVDLNSPPAAHRY
ncbi:hypothetical protein C8R45DRAFT_1133353 [Mycena sanguinolenta]|nr:hypothetical protein C8R45DRAFT_1133353 [Mycena sanguinolenta]